MKSISMQQVDPELYQVIKNEELRQAEKLELIASENYASPAVMEAASTVLTNKYAEGYPGKRYYGGCEHVDVAENLAIERAKELFSCDYANVQPHSGSQANMAVYFAILQPGDTILGMDLAHGGHLTHGAAMNFSGKLYNIEHYGVSRETEQIDYDQVAEIAEKVQPKLIIAGASAYPRTIDFPRFREIADRVGAFFMVDMAHIAGLVSAGAHPTPLPYADFTTSTTHKTLRGPRGGVILIGKDKENALGIKAPKSGRLRKYSEIMDSAVMPGMQGGPLMHIVAAKAVALKEAMQQDFKAYQFNIVKNAEVLSKTLSDGGARIISGGTDNHLILFDVSGFGLSGKEAEAILDEANITVNKNSIPFDTKSPLVTSGIRIGTPAVSSRGMVGKDMEEIGNYILEVLRSKGDKQTIGGVREKVRDLCARYPIVEE
ncbi:MAG: serine hydroxymethyltransferase [Spirochaetales bacterium]|nr:serine hydroxymethyltransferase [Spirochaetales bacterium]MCF7937190.1 serine hydroxymethyltransferase [Spirochaetales bacterium]